MAQRFRTGHRRVAVLRALAKRVVKGQDITEAVFDTMDALKPAPGAICPTRDVPDVQTADKSDRAAVGNTSADQCDTDLVRSGPTDGRSSIGRV